MKSANDKKNYSIQAFADACGTTRDTLYHYEKEGLLIPAIDSRNHYRYYSANDFHLYQYIAHLRRLGFSISEIRSCIQNRTTKTYLQLLKDCQKKCLEELTDAQRRYDIATKSLESVDDYAHKLIGLPQVFYMEEETFFTSSFSGPFDSLEGITQIQEHLKCASSMPDITSNLTVFAFENDLQKGKLTDHVQIMVQTQKDADIDPAHLHKKPAGVYLRVFFETEIMSDDMSSLQAYYQELLQYVSAHNFQVLSELYCYQHIGRFYTDDPKEFLAEFVLRVG